MIRTLSALWTVISLIGFTLSLWWLDSLEQREKRFSRIVIELSLADLEGRVVIVNFWASWCGPCRIEQPDLNAVHALLPDTEVVVVGVNIEDTQANALAHLAEFDVPYVSLFDPVNELAGRFQGIGARTIPSTVFLDPEERVAARLLGLKGTREMAARAASVSRTASVNSIVNL